MDSTNTLPQIETGEEYKEDTANGLFAAASPAMAYANNPDTTALLVFGYLGARLDSTTLIANGTHTCSASTTVYMVVNKSTGAVSFSTSSTNWDDHATYWQAYLITAGMAALTWLDCRGSPNPYGVLVGVGATGSGDMLLASVQTVTGAKTFADQTLKLAGSSSGALKLVAPAAAGSGTVTLPASGTLATEAYVDNAVVGLWDIKGGTDCSANPNYPSALKGDAYVVTVAGKIGGASGTSVDIGDVYVALLDNAGGTEASVGTSWFHLEHNLAGVALQSGNLSQFASTSSAQLAALLSDETGSGAAVFATSPTLVTPALGTPASGALTNCTADGTDAVGFRNIPQNSRSAAYTTVLADAGKHIFHPAADTTARVWTIDSNANVAYPLGTALTFINEHGAGVITIAITSDTMRLAGAGTTGSRTLAADGVATAIKITTTSWIISGTGLT